MNTRLSQESPIIDPDLAVTSLPELQEYAKSLPGEWWVEAAADWHLREDAEGFVVGFADQETATSPWPQTWEG
jgi:hypothetical protein